MKKIFYFGLAAAMVIPEFAGAADNNRRFQREVLTGLDIVTVQETVDYAPAAAPGELGYEVYQTTDAVDASDVRVFIPTTMYIRAGGGLNIGAASSKAKSGDTERKAKGGYTAQVGLGWNLSSYVRTEIDFQTMTLGFNHTDDNASYQSLGATLYFDFARRYVQTGDVTRRRRIVPFMGVGLGVGHYAFDGAGGADGLVLAAPRATAGLNIMFTDLIGIDIAYQYQLMIGDGFGWNDNSTTAGISNVIASFRMNF